MKATARVSVSLVIATILASGQQSKKPTQPSTLGRFSMIVAEVNDGTEDGPKTAAVFVIDSETGRVWRWAPSHWESSQDPQDLKTKTMTRTLFPEHFYAIPFVKEGDWDHSTVRPQ